MNYKIEKVIALTVGTTAQSVKVSGLSFLLQNRSESAAVYFKEKSADGIAATSANGFALAAGAVTPLPLTARELSVVAGAASTDVRVLILDVE